MNLQPPKLRFALFIIEIERHYQNLQEKQSSVVCYADGFDINEAGAITFFHTALTSDNKKVKIPVACYPNGKWTSCVLLDNNNNCPAFNSKSQQEIIQEPTDNEIDELLKQPTYNHINTNQNHHKQFTHTKIGIPGASQHNNPQEYKKQKEEWLENEIKQYIKDKETFDNNSFMIYIEKTNPPYKISESDIIWASSKLIRNKIVMSRKFADPNMQKTLAIILPDIMKRQWDGKMAPILQTLQEREETKNVTAVDLSVWMAQNNYQ